MLAAKGVNLHDFRHKLLELTESGADLYALFMRLCLREEVAGRLLQQLISELGRSRQFERAANGRAHAHRAAIHLAFNWRRERKNEVEHLEHVEQSPAFEEPPADEPIRCEELDEVLDAIGLLRRRGRDVLVMRYIEQRSYDDIAKRLGVTSHHVSMVCHASRERLKARLNRDSETSYREGQPPPEYNERKLLRRLQVLSQIEPRPEAAEHAARSVRTAIEQIGDKAPAPALCTPRRLAITAAVILCVLATTAAVLLWNGRSPEKSPTGSKPSQSATPAAPVEQRSTASAPKAPPAEAAAAKPSAEIKEELRQIVALADSGDIEGLLDTLEWASFAGKLAAAGYLMEIGDESAVARLESLSAEWYGAGKSNPFAAAALHIQNRLAQSLEADSTAPPLEPNSVEPSAAVKPVDTYEEIVHTEAPAKQKGTFRGHVVDAEGNPMVAAVVGIKSYAVELVGRTNDEGAFTIDMPANKTALPSPVAVWATLPNTPDFVGWTLLQSESDKERHGLDLASRIPSDPGTISVGSYEAGWCSGASDVVVVLESAGRITGRITDPTGADVAGAAVTVRFEPSGRKYPNYPYECFWSTRALTDEQGVYQVGYLPRLWKECGWTVSATAEGFVGQSEMFASDGPLDVMTIDLQLYPAVVTIYGVLKNDRGAALADRPISAIVNGWRFAACSTRTDANGKFELKGCPDAQGLGVLAQLSLNARGVRDDGVEFYSDEAVDIPYEPGRAEYEVELVVTAPN